MAYLDTFGLSICIIFPSYQIHSHGSGNRALHGTGTCVESLFWGNPYRRRERLSSCLYSCRGSLWLIPCAGRAEVPVPGLVKLPQGSARKGELVAGKYQQQRGTRPSSRRAQSTLPAWKGCACAGAEPGSPGVAEQFPFFALVSVHPWFYSHFTK